MSSNQVPDLDLDALERDFKRRDMHSTPSDPIVLALIQRVREAEALVEMNRETDRLIHLGDRDRIAQLERVIFNLVGPDGLAAAIAAVDEPLDR